MGGVGGEIGEEDVKLEEEEEEDFPMSFPSILPFIPVLLMVQQMNTSHLLGRLYVDHE